MPFKCTFWRLTFRDNIVIQAACDISILPVTYVTTDWLSYRQLYTTYYYHFKISNIVELVYEKFKNDCEFYSYTQSVYGAINLV